MAISQKRSKRKPTGGRYKSAFSKKQYELGSNPTLTKLEKVKRVSRRVIGSNQKTKFLAADMVNVVDPKTKKNKIVKIKQVTDNPANRNYIRRNILTMGCVVETELGKAKITSRPGQVGTLNAVLISK
ncbi:30S ribosomal protein S8e [Candidatus Woesearchaeota archaeon]|nr:30S ribosomal protein S8e [Candidatus Woesearchaeota archaeon]